MSGTEATAQPHLCQSSASCPSAPVLPLTSIFVQISIMARLFLVLRHIAAQRMSPSQPLAVFHTQPPAHIAI
ncbi:hypothetical protein GE21DRAFT_1356089 [Neurospora crassa]|nr:hypothetical protein GE21DRAFT_1356089 [Neurospora crassa]